MAYLLYRWCDLSDDDGAEVKEWTASLLASDEGVKKFATTFTDHGWSQGLGGLGDLVARRTSRAQVKGLERLMDVAEFRRRVEEVDVAGGCVATSAT